MNKNKIIYFPKEKAHDLRSWIAFRLVDLANWIRPGNKAATAYLSGIFAEYMLEEMLYGRAELEIKVKKYKDIMKG